MKTTIGILIGIILVVLIIIGLRENNRSGIEFGGESSLELSL